MIVFDLVRRTIAVKSCKFLPLRTTLWKMSWQILLRSQSQLTLQEEEIAWLNVNINCEPTTIAQILHPCSSERCPSSWCLRVNLSPWWVDHFSPMSTNTRRRPTKRAPLRHRCSQITTVWFGDASHRGTNRWSRRVAHVSTSNRSNHASY